MKLLNYTTSYLALILLAIIPIWAALFYFNLLAEIYDSIDDGLDNQKLLIIRKTEIDSSILTRSDFDEGDYIIRQVSFKDASKKHDVYIDTSMYMQNEKEFEPVRLLRTYFTHKDKYYELLVFTSMVEEDDLVKQLLYSMAWLYIGLIVTILVLNNVLLRKIWRPFYLLLKRLKGFRLEHPEPVVPEKTQIAEFQLLNQTVQKMLQSNIDAFNNQKQFIENASHELQTPLAISMNKLERFIEENQFNEQQLHMLSGIMDNLVRMQRLNHALLLLFKIENKQFTGETEVNINALTQTVIDGFTDQATYKGIMIHCKEDAACMVYMHPDLANIMITNLLKNALVHNQPNGFVNIIIQKDSFAIENSGSSIALDEKKIFWRFYKEQQSSNSTGLGLAITKAIVERYSFIISYRFENKHVLTINFKQ